MSGDLLVAVGQTVLTACAILMLLKPTTYVPPLLSWIMAAALFSLGMGLFMLSSPVGGFLALLGSWAWLGILVFRGGRGGLR